MGRLAIAKLSTVGRSSQCGIPNIAFMHGSADGVLLSPLARRIARAGRSGKLDLNEQSVQQTEHMFNFQNTRKMREMEVFATSVFLRG
jgi:hypothetical protein